MIFDLHNDFPTKIPPEEYGKYCRENSAKAVVTAAIWTTELVAPLKTVEDTVKALHGDPKCRCAPIAVEDLGFLYDGSEYRTFDFSRFAYCSLTWNYNNDFAGGALDTGGLTAAGRELIRLMNGRCAVDLAHLNKKSFYAALECAEDLCCSHTGFNTHKRSLDDSQVRELLVRHAVIGLCTVTAISGAENSEQFIEIIDRFVQKYGQDGVDCLAIGSDLNGSNDIPDNLSRYVYLDSIGIGLSALGYDEQSIENIKYRNAARLCGRG